MFKKIVPFNTQNHSNLKVKPVDSFNFAKTSHIVSIIVNEFNRVALTYPIVFLKDNEEKYNAYALLGLKQGENLFVDEEGKWQSGYVPAIIRRYPFALGKGQAQDQFIVCIDEESPFINEEEGQPLVKEDGNPGEVVEKAKDFLTEIYRFNELTSRFCRELEDRNLLTQLNMQIKGGEAPVNIAGCFGVDEKKLNALTDDEFLALRKNGSLPLIYAHLLSLAQIERLARLHSQKQA